MSDPISTKSENFGGTPDPAYCGGKGRREGPGPGQCRIAEHGCNLGRVFQRDPVTPTNTSPFLFSAWLTISDAGEVTARCLTSGACPRYYDLPEYTKDCENGC